MKILNAIPFGVNSVLNSTNNSEHTYHPIVFYTYSIIAIICVLLVIYDILYEKFKNKK